MGEQMDESLNLYSDDDDQDKIINKASDKPSGGNFSNIHSASFKDFLLNPQLIKAIAEAGFEHPSEVQANALPRALNGKDMICQANSGMGKTAVFVLAILQSLDHKKPTPISALVLVHAKELAYQIHKEFERLGKYLPKVRSEFFYGGVPIEKDVEKLKSKPAIVIGTPDRIFQLCRKKYLDLSGLGFFVVDECDRIFEQKNLSTEVVEIFTKTPVNKQVMMFSATFSNEARRLASKFMQDPEEVIINDESKLILEGILQYYVGVEESQKNKKLCDLLDDLSFNQVIIFVSKVERAVELNNILRKLSFPSVTIHSGLKTEERIERYKMFKAGNGRILISTDLYARGIDIEKVNVVINYDLPKSSTENHDEVATYLHRVGRTARFGTKGLAISFASTSEDISLLKRIQERFVLEIGKMPETVDAAQYMNQS